MPALIGIVADRWIPASDDAEPLPHSCRWLYDRHRGGGIAFAGYHWHARLCPDVHAIYTFGSVFMPTIGLSNSVAFSVLEQKGLDTITDFPPIRVFGTVGFIAAELLVNFVVIGGQAIQFTAAQFYTSGILSFILAAYCMSLPKCPCKRDASRSLADAFGLKAFRLFRRKDMAIFFVFSMLLGVSLQITNSYGSDFINFFSKLEEFNTGFMNGW